MRVIIAGGRDFADQELFDKAMLNCPFWISEVVSGRAKGADTMGEIWAEKHLIKVNPFLAHWEIYGKAAGHIRNQVMGDHADALIAFPGGHGTRDMVGIMSQSRKPIIIVVPGVVLPDCLAVHCLNQRYLQVFI